MWSRFLVMCLAGLACAPAPLRGVVEPRPGERLSAVPGPMPGFGPFRTPSDALIAACPLIMAMPHAVAGKASDPNFRLYWRLSREYCAWIYRAPNGAYEMSMLTASPAQDEPGKRKCLLPAYVHDARYPDESIGYVFVAHNHPFANELSDDDLRFIATQGQLHGFSIDVGGKPVPLGIVAFFSDSGPDHGQCSGFYEYLPFTGEVQKWTVSSTGEWRPPQILGSIRWTSDTEYTLDRR